MTHTPPHKNPKTAQQHKENREAKRAYAKSTNGMAQAVTHLQAKVTVLECRAEAFRKQLERYADYGGRLLVENTELKARLTSYETP